MLNSSSHAVVRMLNKLHISRTRVSCRVTMIRRRSFCDRSDDDMKALGGGEEGTASLSG